MGSQSRTWLSDWTELNWTEQYYCASLLNSMFSNLIAWNHHDEEICSIKIVKHYRKSLVFCFVCLLIFWKLIVKHLPMHHCLSGVFYIFFPSSLLLSPLLCLQFGFLLSSLLSSYLPAFSFSLCFSVLSFLPVCPPSIHLPFWWLQYVHFALGTHLLVLTTCLLWITWFSGA